MIRIYGLLLLPLLTCLSAGAAEVVEDFSSRARYNPGAAGANEAVWNQSLGKIHPTLVVSGYAATVPAQNIPIDVNVGDGRHGVFDGTTYANFGTVVGSTLFLDTNTYPELNVTRFELPSGITLEPTGNNPLIIRSLGDVIIQGTVECRGRNGANGSGTTGGAGGLPRCGGYAGGAGGSSGADGTSGVSYDSLVTGGTGGAAIESGAGGGGGSWNSTTAGDGSSSTVGGQAGTSVTDPAFTTVAGGAGGGGGASVGTDGGGGGGAGGGVVQIFAVGDFELGSSVDPSIGYIYVNGGDGGNGAGTGAAGGGGGGGSVRVFAGGALRFYNEDPPNAPTPLGGSQAYGGKGGTANGSGGNGGYGRNWLTGTGYSTGGGVTVAYGPTEDAPVDPGDFAHFSSAKQSVITTVFDLRSTIPFISSYTLSPASTDFSVEYAGSDDGFVSDDSGWKATLAEIQGKRYVKFKISVQATNLISPDAIDSATLVYSAGLREDFAFKAAGCGRVNGVQDPLSFSLAALLVLMTWLGLKLKARKAERAGHD